MSTIREFFKLNEYIQLGVCPMKEIQHDVNRNIAALSPEDQRRTKRKFRKLWRKLAAKIKVSEGTRERRYGAKGTAPTKAQRTQRKVLVEVHISARASRAASGKD
jgi:hypothetical protein